MTTPAKVFIAVLRDARKSRRLTIEVLADRTGIPAHSIKRWEDGGQMPRLQSAIRVAAALGYHIELRPIQ